MPVDIALASHLNQNNILPNIPKDPDDYTVFVADYAWADVLINRAEAVKKFYPEIYGTSGQ
jgi:metallo-beta-lactamase class B